MLDAAAAADKATNARDNTEGSGLMKLFACEVRLREGNVREICRWRRIFFTQLRSPGVGTTTQVSPDPVLGQIDVECVDAEHWTGNGQSAT